MQPHGGKVAAPQVPERVDRPGFLGDVRHDPVLLARRGQLHGVVADRTRVVSGKSVSVRVDLGGRRIMNKKKYTGKVHASTISRHRTSTMILPTQYTRDTKKHTNRTTA